MSIMTRMKSLGKGELIRRLVLLNASANTESTTELINEKVKKITEVSNAN